MKSKFILVTLIFFILFSFLLSFSHFVQALKGTNGVEYPDIPECYNGKLENYVIVKSFTGSGIYLLGFNSSEVQLVFDSYNNSKGRRLSFVWKENSFDTCRITSEILLSSDGSRWLSNVSQNISVDEEFKNHPTWVFTTLYGNKGSLWSGKTGYYYYSPRGVGADTFNFEKISDYVLYSNYDIKDINDNIIFKSTVSKNAFIENKEQITTGKFDKVIINAADYTSKEFYLLTYYYSENTDNPFYVMLPRKIIDLKIHNNFFVGTKNEKAIYEVPLSHTGIELKER